MQSRPTSRALPRRSLWPAPRTLRWALFAAAALLLAWTLRLYRLETQSFWYDEGYSVYVSTLPLGEQLAFSVADLIPPLHTLLLGPWLALTGPTEFAARFLSAWAGTLLVAGIVRLGRELDTPRTGFLAGFLAALAPYYIWYSQDARMYMLKAAFDVLALLCLVRALKDPARKRLWIGFAAFEALSLYTHLTTLFLIAFHAALILVVGARALILSLSKDERVLGEGLRMIPRAWTRGALALGGAFLAWLPWLAVALPSAAQNTGYWPGRMGWTTVVQGAFSGFTTAKMLSDAETPAALAVWAAACAISALALLLLRPRHGWRTLLFAVACFALPVAAMAWLFRDVPKFSHRHLIGAAPSIFLLVGAGLSALVQPAGRFVWPRRLAAFALIAGLALSNGLSLYNLYVNPAFAKSDFRTAAHYVRQHIAPDEVVLLVPGHAFPVWQFYFGPDGWVPLPDDRLLDVTHVLHYRETAPLLSQMLAGRDGVWLLEWDPRVVDPTGLAPYLLEQVGDEQPVDVDPVDLRLRHFRIDPAALPLPSQPQGLAPAESSLDLPLRLHGCALPAGLPGDQALRVGCYWEATGLLPHYLSVSARVVDLSGVEWGRADALISGSDFVAGRWPPGELVLGQVNLSLFPGAPPGDFYRLQLLVYEPGGPEHGSVWVAPLRVDRPLDPYAGELPAAPVGRLGGLTLESVAMPADCVRPGGAVDVETVWRVDGRFDAPRLVLEEGDDQALLPQPDALTLWEPGDRYRIITRVSVSPYALGGDMPLYAASADGELVLGTLCVDVTRAFAVPQTAQPVFYRLGDSLALVGVHLSPPGAAGEIVELVLYWQTETLVDRSYTVFAQLIGPDGQVAAQDDSPPQAGYHPTDHWLPGEVVPDPHHLALPAGAPSGDYRILVGLYDLETMDRLPVTDAAGNPLPNDAISIGMPYARE
ncbi:MAG: glycosyltransferase family 39 protein [Anaerolineae bacterium]|nr:glycosyltransferase family 39 protein [Anaerolineae bacterium]